MTSTAPVLPLQRTLPHALDAISQQVALLLVFADELIAGRPLRAAHLIPRAERRLAFWTWHTDAAPFLPAVRTAAVDAAILAAILAISESGTPPSQSALTELVAIRRRLVDLLRTLRTELAELRPAPPASSSRAHARLGSTPSGDEGSSGPPTATITSPVRLIPLPSPEN